MPVEPFRPESLPVPHHVGGVEAPAPSVRLQALDALRGFTVAFMILVNTSGDGAHTYRLLQHARWNGCTLADLVFPCFLVIVGISLVFSVRSRLRRGVARGTLVRQAAVRALILFVLGLAVNTFPLFHWQTLRVFGVLQRIAFCSLAATVLFVLLRVRTLAAWTAALVLVYWVLLCRVPVPWYGVPGVAVPLLDPVANLPAWVDRHLLPAAHLYHQGFYDPEGLLSSVSALTSTLLGVLTGVVLQRKGTALHKFRALLLAGFVALATGLLWSHTLPLNKRLWTGSFVLVTTGVSLLLLSGFYAWLDLWRRGTRLAAPLLIFGTNALLAYALSEFLASLLSALPAPGARGSLQQWFFHPIAAVVPDAYLAALTYAMLYTALCFLPVLWLYRRRIFLKV